MKLTLLAGAIAICAAGAALANDPPSTANNPTSTKAAATFESLDTNSDGRISAAEARVHKDLDAGYRDAVSDSDKGMSQAEFDSWVAGQRRPIPPSN